jgi:electron transport complex protein RnfE
MDKKYSLSSMMYAGAFKYNPVLIQCVALCPVVAATQNLKDAFFIAVAVFADMLVTSFISSLMLKKTARFVRVAVYLILGLILICPVLWVIEFRTLVNMSFTMRVFLPLVAINSATAVHCETFAVKNDVRTAVNDSVAAGVGIGTVMVICGALREIIGSGSILGRSFNFKFTLPGMAMPVGCLVILGFAAAVLQSVTSRKTKVKPERTEVSAQPEEVELDVDGEFEPEQIDIDLTYDNDDEYAYLLSSVNELIDSFTSKENSEEEDNR